MRRLIIPDVHDKVDRVNYILQHETYDRVTLLGDYFDDFTTGVLEARITAEAVRGWLNDPRFDVLLGNHDYGYGWGLWNAQSICAGWTVEKHRAINQILKWHDWKRFKLHTWDGDYLMTHAGFHIDLLYRKDCPVMPQIDNILGKVLSELHSGTWPDGDTNPHTRRPSNRRVMEAGRMRGGNMEFGGVVWCDWGELDGIPGVNQITGHTPREYIRIGDTRKDDKHTRDYCIDTHLHHYAVLEDGALSIVPVVNLANGPVKVAGIVVDDLGSIV